MNEKIHNFLDADRHVFLKTISIQIGFDVATAHRNIHEDVNMRKISAKFVSRRDRCRREEMALW